MIGIGGLGVLSACGPGSPAPGPTSAPAPASTPAQGAPAQATAPAKAAAAPSTVTAAPTPAAAAGSAKRGGTLKVTLDSDIIGIDPHGASAGVDRNVYTAIYNGLVAPDKNLKIVPDLAESWTTPDPRTYIFKLRSGVKFHDGTAFDADAVKKNFDWILDPANASARRPEIVDVGFWAKADSEAMEARGMCTADMFERKGRPTEIPRLMDVSHLRSS